MFGKCVSAKSFQKVCLEGVFCWAKKLGCVQLVHTLGVMCVCVLPLEKNDEVYTLC